MTSTAAGAAELAAFELACKLEHNVPSLTDFLSKIKITNCLSLLIDIFTARDFSSAIFGVTKLLELYNVLWKIPETLSFAFKSLFFSLIKQLPRLFVDIREFFKAVFLKIKGPKSEATFEEELNRVPLEKPDDPVLQTEEQDFVKSPLRRFLETLPCFAKGLPPIILKFFEANKSLPCVVLGWTISVIVLLTGGSCMFVSSFAGKLSKTISNLGSTIKGCESIQKGFSSLSDLVTSNVAKLLGQEIEKPKTSRDVLVDRICAVSDRVVFLAKDLRENPTKYLKSKLFLKDLNKSLEEVNTLYKEIAHATENLASIQSTIFELRKNVEKIQVFYHHLLNDVVGKMEPVTLYLYGPPGGGKSAVAKHIAGCLVPEESGTSALYVRSATDSFWSGYVGQLCVLFDDFNASHENEDHKDMVAIYSPNSYLLNMAELVDKGSHFTSEFMIVCSNMPVVTRSQKVQIPEIMDRRRDFVYEVHNPALEELKRNNECTPENEKDIYKADFSHLTFTQKNKYRDPNGQLPDLENGRNQLYQIIAQMKTLHRERSAAFEAAVKQKLAAMEGVPEALEMDTNIRRLIQQAQEEIEQMPATEVRPNIYEQIDGVLVNIPHEIAEDHTHDDIVAMAREEARNYIANLPTRNVRNEAKRTVARRPCILLIGPPGIGKTQMTEQPGVAYQVVDEFTSFDELFLETVKRVWKVYDGEEAPFILTCNTITLEEQFIKHFNGDPEKFAAFMRRCEVMEFEFKYNSHIFYTRYTSKDLQSGKYKYDDIVNIKWTSIEGKERKPTFAYVQQTLKKHISYQQQVQFTAELESLDCVCSLEVAVNLTEEEIMAPSFKIGLSDVPGLLRICKGDIKPHLTKLYKIASLFNKSVGDLEATFMAFNDLEIADSDCPNLGLTFKDKKRFVMVQKDGVLKVFKAPHIFEDLEVSEEQANKMRSERFKSEDPLGFTLVQFFSAIEFVMKFGLVMIGVYKYGETRSRESFQLKMLQHIMKKRAACVHESEEYDDLDDYFDDYERYMGKPHPKSLVNTERRDTYCSTHHRWDRCYLLESKRPSTNLLYSQTDSRRNQHIDTHIVLEGSDDLVNNVKRTITPKVVAEGSDDLVNNVLKRTPKPLLVAETVNQDEKVEKKFSGYFKTKTMTKEDVEFQTCLDKSAINQIWAVSKNALLVQRQDGDTYNRALMLKGHIGVVNGHAVREGETIFLNDGEVVMTGVVFRVIMKKDLAFFKLAKQARMFCDITHLLASAKELKSMEGRDGILVTKYHMNGKDQSVWRATKLGNASEMQIAGLAMYGLRYTGHQLGVTFAALNTTYGDCGSFLVVNDTEITKKLVGIHTAGSTHYCIASIITKEDVESACAQVNFETLTVEEDIVVLKHQEVATNIEATKTLCGMPIFGVCEKPDGTPNKQFHPVQTKLWTSPFAFDEKFTEKFEPAVLSAKDPRCTAGANPYLDSMQKWANEQPEIDEELLTLAATEIGDFLAHRIACEQYPIRVLTKTEAINGIGGVPCSNPIYRGSSPGYPAKHRQGVLTKDVFFDFDETTQLQVIAKNDHGKWLNHAIDSLICCAKDKKRSAVVFTSALKDETLKLKKIYDVTKTRTFSGSPVDYTIASRMYFHAAAAAISSLYNDIPVKIGINPRSDDWHFLYLYHAKVSQHGFDGDFSNWDGSIPKSFMEKTCIIYNRIYKICDKNWTEKDDTIRTWLHKPVEGPLITCLDYVVKAPGGNPSGQPQTTLDNCLCNWMLGYYCFAKIMRRANKPCTFKAFCEKVRASYFGDDNMYTVAYDILDTFNFSSFKEEAEKIGFVLTNAAKDGTSNDRMYLKDMEFLKRKFTLVHGRYYGGLIDASMGKMLAHCRNGNKAHFWADQREVGFDKDIVNTIYSVYLEAAIRGEEFYNEVMGHIRKQCILYGIKCDIPSFHTALSDSIYGGLAYRSEEIDSDLKESELSLQTKLRSKPLLEHLASAVAIQENDSSILDEIDLGETPYEISNQEDVSTTDGNWGSGDDGPRNGRRRHSHFLTGCGSTAIRNRSRYPHGKCEFARSLALSTIQSDRHTYLEHVNDCWDCSSRFTNSSKILFRLGRLFHKSVQHVVRRSRLSYNHCRNWFQRRKTGLGTLTAKCQTERHENTKRLEQLQLHVRGCKGTSNIRAKHYGSEKHNVSLHKAWFQRERPNNFWWVFLHICANTIDWFKSPKLFHQLPGPKQIGTGVCGESVDANRFNGRNTWFRRFRITIRNFVSKCRNLFTVKQCRDQLPSNPTKSTSHFHNRPIWVDELERRIASEREDSRLGQMDISPSLLSDSIHTRGREVVQTFIFGGNRKSQRTYNVETTKVHKSKWINNLGSFRRKLASINDRFGPLYKDKYSRRSEICCELLNRGSSRSTARCIIRRNNKRIPTVQRRVADFVQGRVRNIQRVFRHYASACSADSRNIHLSDSCYDQWTKEHEERAAGTEYVCFDVVSGESYRIANNVRQVISRRIYDYHWYAICNQDVIQQLRMEADSIHGSDWLYSWLNTIDAISRNERDGAKYVDVESSKGTVIVSPKRTISICKVIGKEKEFNFRRSNSSDGTSNYNHSRPDKKNLSKRNNSSTDTMARSGGNFPRNTSGHRWQGASDVRSFQTRGRVAFGNFEISGSASPSRVDVNAGRKGEVPLHFGLGARPKTTVGAAESNSNQRSSRTTANGNSASQARNNTPSRDDSRAALAAHLSTVAAHTRPANGESGKFVSNPNILQPNRLGESIRSDSGVSGGRSASTSNKQWDNRNILSTFDKKFTGIDNTPDVDYWHQSGEPDAEGRYSTKFRYNHDKSLLDNFMGYSEGKDHFPGADTYQQTKANFEEYIGRMHSSGKYNEDHAQLLAAKWKASHAARYPEKHAKPEESRAEGSIGEKPAALESTTVVAGKTGLDNGKQSEILPSNEFGNKTIATQRVLAETDTGHKVLALENGRSVNGQVNGHSPLRGNISEVNSNSTPGGHARVQGETLARVHPGIPTTAVYGGPIARDFNSRRAEDAHAEHPAAAQHSERRDGSMGIVPHGRIGERSTIPNENTNALGTLVFENSNRHQNRGSRNAITGVSGRSASNPGSARRNSISSASNSVTSTHKRGGFGGAAKHLAGAAGITAVAGLAGHAISAGANLAIQKQSQNFTQGLIDQHRAALAESGLPSYMAYGSQSGGTSGASQHMGQVAAGRTVYLGKAPGRTDHEPYTGSYAQIGAGFGAII